MKRKAHNKRDLTGVRFGHLTVISEADERALTEAKGGVSYA